MKRSDLRQCLRREMEVWSAKPFSVLIAELGGIAAYQVDGAEPYQVEVQIIEQNADSVHVAIAVDDGGLSAFVPPSAGFLVYRDGRVEMPAL
jgi:uncharacterized protein YqiB (DUF1249 family)